MLKKVTCAHVLRFGVVTASLLFAGTPFAQLVPENASGIKQFSTVQNGLIVETTTSAVQKDIKPIPCSQF